ncbi:MAG: hypothetical protein K1X74_15255 [Pirellulales bacterium]|nr:hypothetical protein [Pirellulales bacterium]
MQDRTDGWDLSEFTAFMAQDAGRSDPTRRSAFTQRLFSLAYLLAIAPGALILGMLLLQKEFFTATWPVYVWCSLMVLIVAWASRRRSPGDAVSVHLAGVVLPLFVVMYTHSSFPIPAIVAGMLAAALIVGRLVDAALVIRIALLMASGTAIAIGLPHAENQSLRLGLQRFALAALIAAACWDLARLVRQKAVELRLRWWHCRRVSVEGPRRWQYSLASMLIATTCGAVWLGVVRLTGLPSGVQIGFVVLPVAVGLPIVFAARRDAAAMMITVPTVFAFLAMFGWMVATRADWCPEGVYFSLIVSYLFGVLISAPSLVARFLKSAMA